MKNAETPGSHVCAASFLSSFSIFHFSLGERSRRRQAGGKWIK